MNKYQYLLSSFGKRLKGQPSYCPHCKQPEAQGRSVDTKYTVTRLIECTNCHLLYRTPADSVQEAHAFYQEEYEQGYTTGMPDDATLKQLLSAGFSNTERDYGRYVALMDALKVPRSAKVLDFGCSWGYGTYQFQQAGYAATGFEISQPRCKYAADKLGVDAHHRYEDLGSGYQVFFSSHVLEHVDSIADVWNLARRVLAPGGFFIGYTPNGSEAYRQANFRGFHLSWGLKHPNLLQDRFVEKLADGLPALVSSTPHALDAIAGWDQKSTVRLDTSGWELLLIIRK